MSEGSAPGTAMLARARDVWSGSSLRSKLAAGAAIILAISAVLILAGTRTADTFTPLASGLAPEDAHQVVQTLEEQKIPFELQDGGATVTVPRTQVDEARLELAGKGVPQGTGGAGFELFDRNSLTFTDFTERVAYQRALQGELARTLNSMDGVESARVHLSMPERELFANQARKPSAAVTVGLEHAPSDEQVRAIVQTVANSVPDLETSRITVSTSEGRVVWTGGADSSAGAKLQMTLQRQLENDLEGRLKALLAPLVGDRAVLRVTATVDMSAAEVTAESFTPSIDGTPLKSRRLVNEEYGPQTRGQEKRRYDHREEAVEYQLSKETRRTEVPAGRLQRLHVAVLVDAQVASPALLEAIERSVRVAAGLDTSRGDELVVQSVPFLDSRTRARTAGANQKTPPASNERPPARAFPWFSVVLGLALSALLLVPLLIWMRRSNRSSEDPEPLDPASAPDEDRELLRLLNDWSHEHVDL